MAEYEDDFETSSTSSAPVKNALSSKLPSSQSPNVNVVSQPVQQPLSTIPQSQTAPSSNPHASGQQVATAMPSVPVLGHATYTQPSNNQSVTNQPHPQPQSQFQPTITEQPPPSVISQQPPIVRDQYQPQTGIPQVVAPQQTVVQQPTMQQLGGSTSSGQYQQSMQPPLATSVQPATANVLQTNTSQLSSVIPVQGHSAQAPFSQPQSSQSVLQQGQPHPYQPQSQFQPTITQQPLPSVISQQPPIIGYQSQPQAGIPQVAPQQTVVQQPTGMQQVGHQLGMHQAQPEVAAQPSINQMIPQGGVYQASQPLVQQQVPPSYPVTAQGNFVVQNAPEIPHAPPQATTSAVQVAAPEGQSTDQPSVMVKPCFASMNLERHYSPPRQLHCDPHEVRVNKLREKQRLRDQRVIEHARMQLLRKEMYDKQLLEKSKKEAVGKENQKDTEAKSNEVVPTAEAKVVPLATTDITNAFQEYDKKFGTCIEPSSICSVVYTQDANFVESYLKKCHEKTAMTNYEMVNCHGFVSYHGRALGIKKVKGNFHLGYGAKATPLHFAALAARLDVVLLLLRLGANPREVLGCKKGIPSAFRVAKKNGADAVCEVIKNFVQQETKEKQSKILRAQIPFMRTPRSRSSSRCPSAHLVAKGNAGESKPVVPQSLATK